jgi:hypothetical protein
MAEVFSWPEGACYLWTGTATASALVVYQQQTQITMDYGVQNFRTLDSAYHNAWTGQRADIQIGALHTTDHLTLEKFAAARTGVHIHFVRTGVAGVSAGRYFYSGAINAVQERGQAGGFYEYGLTYHANDWSAY